MYWTEVSAAYFDTVMGLYGIQKEENRMHAGPGIHTFRGKKMVSKLIPIWFSECNGRFWVGHQRIHLNLAQTISAHKHATDKMGQGNGTRLPQSRDERKSAA